MTEVASARVGDGVGCQPTAADPRDYLALMKPRVMSLVVFTAFVGLLAAPGPMHPVLAFAALLFVAVGAGAAGALNMWFDADIDAIMRRTQSRPIPRGASLLLSVRGAFVQLRGGLAEGQREADERYLPRASVAGTSPLGLLRYFPARE